MAGSDRTAALVQLRRTFLLVATACGLLACGDEARVPAGDADAVAPGDGLGEVATPDAEDAVGDTDAVLEAWPVDTPVPAGKVAAGVATSAGALIGGSKQEGRLGDLVLRNAVAHFVVEGARVGGGYRHYGGNVVDAAPVVDGVTRPDRFGEAWFGWNLMAFVPIEAEVISDGRDGVAHVRLRGRTGAYDWPDSFIRPILNPGPADLEVIYDYRLWPDTSFVALTITLINDGERRVTMDFPFLIMNMGDGVKSFAPGRGFAGATGATGLPWIGAVGHTVSYAVVTGNERPMTGLFSYANVDLVTLPSFFVQAGETVTIPVAIAVSDEGTSGLDLRTGPTPQSIRGQVLAQPEREPARGDAEAEARWVSARGAQGEVLGVAPLREDGIFDLRLEVLPGTPVTVQAWAPGLGGTTPVTVEAPDGSVTLSWPEPATLEVTVVDGDGEQVPAQLTLFRAEGTASPFAPADVRIGPDPGGGRSALAYVIDAKTKVRVPAGRYRAVASRGYSYELDEAIVELEAGEVRELAMTVERVVDTTGWLAADMHLHGRWSSDSDVPYDARVRQAAANDVALPMLTEHAYVGDLMSAASEAGVDEWVAPIPAQEVTTFEYGHFNAFPLVYDPDLPSGGGVYEHGRAGTELFDAMRNQHPGEVVIQVNHPRSQVSFFAYFDYVGLDSTTGQAARPERFTDNWDLIEVFNGRCVGSAGNDRALADWIALTNLGWRKTLSSGSDSHSEGSGLGHPRGWIALEKTALELDPQSIVAPLLARQTFVSCGPFVRFSAADGAQMGEMTEVDGDGEVAFAVEVWAPTWIGVTEVRLWENGVPVVVETFEDAWSGPEVATPAKRFDGVMRHRPVKDAWYAVEVIGTGSLAPVELGDQPYALTNPIEVDVDGDGIWTPPGNPANSRAP